MRISVVICAYTMDRWSTLVAAVRSCGEQTLKPDEVIVVIDYNEELRLRATKEFGGVRVVANKSTKGVSGARNTGVAAAYGDIVAFLDDDAYADKDWLEQLTLPMTNPKVAGVGGWILPHWPAEPPAWFPETFLWILGCSYAGLPETNFPIRNPIGASMAIHRRVFSSVGGFTEGIGRIGLTPLGCEETELCIRYTAAFPDEQFVMARDAVVHQWVPVSRLTWHYFWTRCWAEGLSKAAVSFLVGSDSGLSAERQHVIRALPREFASTLRALFTHPKSASSRLALIVIGTTCAAAGVVWGRVAVRLTPIAFSSGDLSSLAEVLRSEESPLSSMNPSSVNPSTEPTSLDLPDVTTPLDSDVAPVALVDGASEIK
ncbi:MAG: glycosyltransferase family 2 protein [Acidimicrobiales bacterium]